MLVETVTATSSECACAKDGNKASKLISADSISNQQTPSTTTAEEGATDESGETLSSPLLRHPSSSSGIPQGKTDAPCLAISDRNNCNFVEEGLCPARFSDGDDGETSSSSSSTRRTIAAATFQPVELTTTTISSASSSFTSHRLEEECAAKTTSASQSTSPSVSFTLEEQSSSAPSSPPRHSSWRKNTKSSTNVVCEITKVRACGAEGSWNRLTFRCLGCGISSFHGWKPCRDHMLKCCPDILPRDWPELNRWQGRCRRENATFLPVPDEDGEVSTVPALKVWLKGKRCKMAAGGKKKRPCHCAVCPSELFCLRCVDCGHSFRVSEDDKAHYLRARRQTRRSHGLLSATVALDGYSFSVLSGAASLCGIFSNTSVAHLTLAEGLRRPRGGYSASAQDVRFEFYLLALQTLRTALAKDSTATVVGVHFVPRLSDPNTVLVIADVALSADAEQAAGMFRHHLDCVLPQFPLHIALGACEASRRDDALAMASNEIVGRAVNLRHLSMLPPSLDQMFSSCDAERAKGPNDHFPAIAKAVEACRKLNNALAYGPVC